MSTTKLTKAYGYGTPYDRLRAVDRHIDEVQRIRQAEQDGTMGAREARKARFQAARCGKTRRTTPGTWSR